MIEVLIVDDLAVVRQLIRHILSSDPEIEVIGEASNGQEALDFIQKRKPHVITMDMVMPKMDGLTALRHIMENDPIPVLIVSASYQDQEVEKSFLALSAGAVAVADKPRGPGSPDYKKRSQNLIQMVKTTARVQMVRRTPISFQSPPAKKIPSSLSTLEVIGIGASTGGPQVLEEIFQKLPADFPWPLLVVQHISSGFLSGMIQWFQEKSPLSIQVAQAGQKVEASTVYLAPYGLQMGLHDGEIFLENAPQEHHQRPSVSYLFRSLAKNYGSRTLGILLTGMGKDGALELGEMKNRGAITIAQDQKSSMVFGMPGEAVKLGGAQMTLSPSQIIRELTDMATLKKLK